MKWSVKRGWRTSQRWIVGVLWVDELSTTNAVVTSSVLILLLDTLLAKLLLT